MLLRLAEGRFWLSLADADILLWAQVLAHAWELDVTVLEPDVAPLQIQGPRSPNVVTSLFGEGIAGLGYYRFVERRLEGVPMVVARTGWSGEMGFEVFLQDGDRGGWS